MILGFALMPLNDVEESNDHRYHRYLILTSLMSCSRCTVGCTIAHEEGPGLLYTF